MYFRFNLLNENFMGRFHVFKRRNKIRYKKVHKNICIDNNKNIGESIKIMQKYNLLLEIHKIKLNAK